MLDKNLVKDIIELKEGEGWRIGSVGFGEHPESGQVGVLVNINNGFEELLEEYAINLIMVGTEMVRIYSDELERDLLIDELNVLINVILLPHKEEGIDIPLQCPYLGKYCNDVRDEDYRRKVESLIEDINKLSRALTDKINRLINEAIENES